MHHDPIPDAMAERIAALLDKAESTSYPEEADAFLAKAQQLMARHAIDEAMLDAARGSTDEITQVDLTIVAPYASAKSVLLGAVAASNRCRVVSASRPGGRVVCTMVGFETDIRHARSLYLSLSHQAVRFMLDAPLPPGDTPRRFRHSFLLAYAQRIGERLREADRAAHDEATSEQLAQASGRSVSLVMASREARVDRALREAFPQYALDEQQRQTQVALGGVGIGAHRHHHHIGAAARRDEHLAAVYDVAIALADRSGRKPGHVAAGAGLGDGQGGNHLAAQHGGDKALFLFDGAQVQDQRQRDGVAAQAGCGADGAAVIDQRVCGHQSVGEVAARAAVLLGIAHAQHTGRRAVGIERPRELLSLVPGGGVGGNRLFAKATQLLAQRRMLLGFKKVGAGQRHGSSVVRLEPDVASGKDGGART